MEKQKKRDEVMQRIKEMSAKGRKKLDKLIIQKIKQLQAFQTARVIMTYYPLEDEVDIDELNRGIIHDGKKLVLPLCTTHPQNLLPIEVTDIDAQVHKGAHGLMEPDDNTPIDLKLIDLILIPGRGFDLEGNRIGRGKGYYDRFLSSKELKALRCGVGYFFQVYPEIPTHPHDQVLDIIITDHNLITINGNTS